MVNQKNYADIPNLRSAITQSPEPQNNAGRSLDVFFNKFLYYHAVLKILSQSNDRTAV